MTATRYDHGVKKNLAKQEPSTHGNTRMGALESRDKGSLIVPVIWQCISQDPLTGQPDRLTAFHNHLHNIRSQEGEFDNLLNTAS